MRAAQPQKFRVPRMVHIVHPFFHDGEMLFKQLFVAVGAPNFIRHDTRRIAPGGRRLLLIKMRNDPIDFTVLALFERHILHPLGKKALDIEVDSPRAAKHLRVARPAETLVPLRTVGGDVEIVALLPPNNIMIQLIDLLIAADKIAGARHVGMHRHGGERIEIDRVKRIFRQTNIAKALKRVKRCKIARFPVKHIGDAAFGGAVVLVIKIAVRVEHLAVMQHNAVALFADKVQADIPGKILPEIHERLVFRRFQHGNGLYHVLLADPLARLRDDARFHVRQHRRAETPPPRRVVLRFTEIKTVHRHRRRIHPPRFVGRDRFRAAVRIGDGERNQKRAVVGIAVVVMPVFALDADRPADADADRKAVVLFQQRRHIIGLKLHPVLICRPSRHQHAVPHPFAVERRDIHAHRRRPQFGLFHRLCEHKVLFKAHRREIGRLRRADPFSESCHPYTLLSCCFQYTAVL